MSALSDMVAQASFAEVVQAVISIGAALAALFVLIRASWLILRAIDGGFDSWSDIRGVVNHGFDGWSDLRNGMNDNQRSD